MKKIDWENGVKEEFEFDPLTNEIHIKRTQDVEANLEYSKGLANNDEVTKKGIKSGMWHYAHIPNMLLAQWIQLGINVNDTKEILKQINKPEYKYLKTTTKTHS